VLTAGVARELARREGIKLVVEGDVRPVGGGYMIAARLVAPASGEVLAAFRESAADPGAIIGAIDRLSKQARAKIGESLKAVRAAPSLERVTTGSFAALEKYSQAMAAQRRGDDGARVTQLLTEATEIDSTFAMAYAQMCCLLSLSRSQAIDVGGRAMRYRDRLPAAERYQVEIIQAMDANEMEQVIGAARNALELDSLNASAHQALGVAFGRRREFDRAETHFRRAIVADSVRGDRPVGIRYSALARVQFMQGQVDAARRTLERGRQVVRGPGPPFPVLLAGLDFATGRYDDGDRKLREAAAAAPAGPGRRPLEAALQAADLMRGRLASGSRALEATGAEAAKAGRRPQALALQVVIVQLTARVLGDTAAARRRLVTALEQYPLDAMAPADRPYLIVAQAHAMVGDTAAAAATMAAFDRAASDIVGRRGKQALDGVALTRAMVASARGDHQRAATFAREADVGNCPACALDVLAQAYDGAGMADSARAVYERYVTLPHFERVYDGPAARGRARAPRAAVRAAGRPRARRGALRAIRRAVEGRRSGAPAAGAGGARGARAARRAVVTSGAPRGRGARDQPPPMFGLFRRSTSGSGRHF
jgi:tetratricopeptide (TPR) repeat protein